MDNLIELIKVEVGDVSVPAQLSISPNLASDKLKEFLESKNPLIKNIIEVAIRQTKAILADGRIGLDDIPALLQAFVSISADIDALHKQQDAIKLTSNDLIDLTLAVLQIVVQVMVTDPGQQLVLLGLVSSAVSLIRFSFSPESWDRTCCC